MLRNLLLLSTPRSASAPKPRGRPKKTAEATVRVESERKPVGLRSAYADGEASTHASKKKTIVSLVESLETIAKTLAPSPAIAASGPTEQTRLYEAGGEYIATNLIFHKIHAVQLASQIRDTPYFDGLAAELRNAVAAASPAVSGAAESDSDSDSASDGDGSDSSSVDIDPESNDSAPMPSAPEVQAVGESETAEPEPESGPEAVSELVPAQRVAGAKRKRSQAAGAVPVAPRGESGP